MPRIICIDPDAGRVQEPVEVLRSAGYEVMLASSADVGLALVRLFPPDLVLLHRDLAERLLPQIRQTKPAIPVVLTGDTPILVEELEWVADHPQEGIQAPEIHRVH
jgi:DNA-binding response OmpR family regulator